MQKKFLGLVSVILAVALMLSIIISAPFSASAAENDSAAVASVYTENPFGEPSGGVYTLTNATYRLTDDVVLAGYLRIPSGVTAVIDLNGHTIDRGLSASANISDFILNQGTLTIKDSGSIGKLTGGYAYQGGVVENTGTLTIEGGNFVENRARLEGGAVFNGANATLTVTGGKFTNNVSETYGGGAFVNKGTMTLSGGTISGNIAKMDGGGIYNAEGATLTFTGGTVTGNCAGGNNSNGDFEGKAGGIYNNASGTLKMNGSPVIKDNANGNLWLGGDSVITVTGNFGDNAQIDVSADNLLKANNTTRAVTSGFPYRTSNRNVFTFASGMTKASLVSVSSNAEITPYIFKDYTVDNWDNLKAAAENASNGATIVVTKDITNPTVNDSHPIEITDKTITIELMGHTIDRNRTSSHSDGHVFWFKGSAESRIRDTAGGGVIKGGYATNGGGVNVAKTATLNLYNVNVSGNKATDGGGIFVRGKLNVIGGVIRGNSSSDDGGAIHICDEASGVSIKNTLITNNSSDSQAGAIYQDKNITATLENTFIINNSSDDKGGGIYLEDGTIDMTGGAVSGNSSTAGGGVYTIAGNTFTADGTVFCKNATTPNAGGAISTHGVLTLTDCIVSENSSTEKAGGIYTGDGATSTTLTNTSIKNNTAAIGGGIGHYYGTVTLVGCTVTCNSATGQGGGVYNNASVSVSGSTVITDNTANGSANDLHMESNNTLMVADALNGDAKIGIHRKNSGLTDVFTSGLSGNGDASNFVSNHNGYAVGVNNNGEALLVPYADGLGERLVGHSISLDGDIGVNFYMELDELIAANLETYMHFTLPSGGNTFEKKVPISEARRSGKYYIFKCNVAAKEMDSTITARIISGAQLGTEYTYSVRNYADYLLDNANEQHPEYLRAKPLVEAMLQYGIYAANYFGTADALSDINATIPEKDYTAAGIGETLFDGATLSLKSQTTLSLYFVSEQALTLSMDGKTEGTDYELDHSGNEYVIRIRNIAAKDLNNDFTVAVTSNGQSGTVTYSPLTYCYKALNADNAKLVNTVKALYNYHLAAHEYF